MALVIKATPGQYSSIHDDLIYTVSEAVHAVDPVTYPNYKYIADVYIGGSMIARVKKVPDPSTYIGIFNIGQIVRNYIATTFNPVANQLRAQQLGENEFFLNVQVKFGEEYALTSYYALLSDSSRVYFNNYNDRISTAGSSLSSFTNKIASNRPLITQVLLSSQYHFVPYFPINTTAIPFVVTPSGGGTPLSTTITPTITFNMQVLNVAPGAINAVAPGTITAATTSYTVQIGSQTIRVEIICEAIHQVYTLHFLNKLGGYETKLFTKVSRKTISIERKDFGKLGYSVDPSGVVSYRNSNGVYNEIRSVYASQFKEKLTLNSDFITDTEYSWLAELVASPMVYLEDSGYLFPCVISASDYEYKKYVNDDLTNLTINIEFGNQLNAQFR